MPSSVIAIGISRALGELPDDRRGVRQDDAVAGEDDRPLRRVDQLAGRGRSTPSSTTHSGRACGLGAAASQSKSHDDCCASLVMSISTGPGRPLAAMWNASRTAGAEILRPRHQVVVLGDRQRDAGDVGLLEAVAANQLAADLAGDADDRHGVHHRGGDARSPCWWRRGPRWQSPRRPCRSRARSRRPCAWRPARGAPARGGSGSRASRRTPAGSRRPDTRRRS